MIVEHFFSLDQPLHRLPDSSQVSTANLSHFCEIVEHLGGNPPDILARYGLSPEVVQQREGFVDCQAVVDMLEFCAVELNSPLFGAALGETQSPDIFGVVAAVCRAAPTLRDAIHGLIRYIPVIHSSESVLTLVEGRTTAELRWSERSNLGANEQATYQGMLLNLKLLRMLAGT